MYKISVLINTLNCEKTIENTLRSVLWADEIVVVDMESEDKTLDIVKKFTSTIYSHKRTGFPVREFGLSKISCEYILIVDSDEIVSPDLARRLRFITESTDFEGVLIPRENYFFGYSMKGGGFAPFQDYQIRFGKVGYIIAHDITHNDFSFSKNSKIFKIYDINERIIHFAYIDWKQFLRKFDFWATSEANDFFNGKKTFSLFKSFLAFFYRAFYLKGFLDGMLGFTVNLFIFLYKIIAFLKFKKMKNGIDEEKIILERYRCITEEILHEKK